MLTLGIGLVLILLVLAIVLFSLERVPLEVSALIILCALYLTGLVKPQDLFAGFGSDVVIMLAGLFILSRALLKTGIVDQIGAILHGYSGNNPFRIVLFLMLAAATLSAFMSNTAATAVFLPVAIGLARKAKISPSRLLLPLAFASILSSSITLISTSTNIVVSGVLTHYDMPPMRMFELSPVGIPIVLAGLVYMVVVGIRLLPSRAESKIESEYHLRDYLTEVLVLPNSPLVGKTLVESKFGEKMDLFVVGLVRGKEEIHPPHPNERILPGDYLLVEGSAEDILRIKNTAGIEIKADWKLGEDTFAGTQMQLVEAIVMPGSELRAKTLKQTRFRDRFGLVVLAINRRGVTLRSKLSQIPILIGDILLLQGSKEQLHHVVSEGYFTLVSDVSKLHTRTPKAKHALLIFVGTVLLVSFNIMPFGPAALIGTLMMILFGAITPEEAIEAVEWRVILLIGTMLAFGTAMEESGAASWLASKIVYLLGNFGPRAVLSGFFLLTVILTQPMSNQAAALVILPVAIQSAFQMDANPRTFAMMIAVASSCSYLTPFEPSCMLVYGPGRYRFGDFLKVGLFLTAIIFGIALLLVPRVWPLEGK